MDDNDLLAAVREDFAEVRMSTEAGAALAAGDALRRRRRLRGAYGATATALCAVAAFGAVTLTHGPAGTAGTTSTAGARLTAWTVQKEPDGTVDVTIRDLENLPGLQQQLNADGVPAVVYDGVQNPPGCVNDEASADMEAVLSPGTLPGSDAFAITPSGIPSGSELLIDVFYGDAPQNQDYGHPMAGSASSPRRAPRARTRSR